MLYHGRWSGLAFKNRLSSGRAGRNHQGGAYLNKISNDKMWRQILYFLIPLIMSNILQSVNGTITSIFLGQMVGVNALAVVSLFFPVFFFLISFVIGIGSGSSVLIGQSYGAGDYRQMQITMGTTLTFTLLTGVVLGAVGVEAAAPMQTQIGTPPDIIQQSVNYARVMFTGMPLLFVFAVYTTFLRGAGDSKTPLYFLGLSTVLTALFSPALIAGWGGLPRLDVTGVAYANIGAAGITFLLLLAYLSLTGHPLKFSLAMLPCLRINWRTLKLLLQIGIPTSIQMLFISLAEIAVVSFVNKYGSSATAAYGAVNQIISYVEMPAISLGIAVSIFGAQAIGAGRADNLREVIRAGFLMNWLIAGLTVALGYILSPVMLSWFLVDPVTRALAHRLLMIMLWGYLIFGNMTVIAGIMRASGVVFWPTVLTLGSIWGVLVPAAYFLSARIGIEGIWMAYPIEFSVGLLLQYGYYRFFWRHKEHTRLI